jgi:hypothetical protein
MSCWFLIFWIFWTMKTLLTCWCTHLSLLFEPVRSSWIVHGVVISWALHSVCLSHGISKVFCRICIWSETLQESRAQNGTTVQPKRCRVWLSGFIMGGWRCFQTFLWRKATETRAWTYFGWSCFNVQVLKRWNQWQFPHIFLSPRCSAREKQFPTMFIMFLTFHAYTLYDLFGSPHLKTYIDLHRTSDTKNPFHVCVSHYFLGPNLQTQQIYTNLTTK